MFVPPPEPPVPAFPPPPPPPPTIMKSISVCPTGTVHAQVSTVLKVVICWLFA